MRNRFGPVLLAVFSIACLIAGPRPSPAYFERVFLSARNQSMGGAFVGVANDASATIINPAGLTEVNSVSFLSSLARPYGLSDLSESCIAAAVPTRFGNVGLAWHRFALEDVTSEDLFSLSFGRDLIRRSQGASLSIGAGLDVVNVSYAEDEIDDSKTAISGSVGVLLRPFPMIGIGYAVRNIGEPSFDFIAGGGATSLGMTHTFGLAYHWNDACSILYDRERDQDAKWQNRFGLEVFAGANLRVRAGLAGSDVTGGIGVVISNLTIDAGVTAHEVLGTTYMVSVGVALPSGDEKGPGKW
ncbi:MAG: hypothetical protein P8181_06850 [bacterium]